MIIPANDLRKKIGEVIIISNDEDLEDGHYQIVDEDDTGTTLYDIKREVVREVQFDKEAELTTISMETEDRLRLLYDANSKIVLNLMNEGWVLSDDVNCSVLDVTPWLEKIKIIKFMLGDDYE